MTRYPLLVLFLVLFFTIFVVEYKIESCLSQVTYGYKTTIQEDHKSGGNAFCFSPDGNLLAYANNDSAIKVVDVINGKLIQSLNGHKDQINNVTFSPDGKIIISESNKNIIKLWDIASGQWIIIPGIDSEYVKFIRFSPNGKVITSVSYNDTIKIWDATSRKLIRKLEGNSGSINYITFSPDSKIIAIVSLVIIGKQVRETKVDDSEIFSLLGLDNYEDADNNNYHTIFKLYDLASGKIIQNLELDINDDYLFASIHFYPNNKIIAITSYESSKNFFGEVYSGFKLWDVNSGKAIRTHKLAYGTSWPRFISISLNNEIIAFVKDNKTIELRKFLTGKLIKNIIVRTDSINSINFSPDNRFIASVNNDRTIKLYDLTSGKYIRTLRGNVASITSVNFSPDGKLIASGSNDKTIKLWNIASGQIIKSFIEYNETIDSVKIHPDSFAAEELIVFPEDHIKNLKTICYSPDGKVLASCDNTGVIKLWNLTTGKPYKILIGHIGAVNYLTFSPDGKLLASGGNDNTVKLWDTISGQLIKTLIGHSKYINSISFSPDCKIIVSASLDNVSIWDATSGQLTKTFELDELKNEEWFATAGFSPDNKIIALTYYEESYSDLNRLKRITINLWDVLLSKRIQKLSFLVEDYYSITSIILSSDIKTIAMAGYAYASSLFFSQEEDEEKSNTIKLWDLVSGRLIRDIKVYTESIKSINFSIDNKIIASGNIDKTIKLWNANTGDYIRTFRGHNGSIYSVTFSSDGKMIASISHDATIKLWDFSSGELLKTFSRYSELTDSPKFSLESFDSVDSSVVDKIVLDSKHTGIVNTICISSNNKWLASGGDDGAIKLWDIVKGKIIHTLRGHTGSINSLSFTPDCRIIASASDDGTVKLWSTASGEVIRTLKGHSESVKSVKFSPDGNIIVSINAQNVVIFDVASGQLQRTLELDEVEGDY